MLLVTVLHELRVLQKVHGKCMFRKKKSEFQNKVKSLFFSHARVSELNLHFLLSHHLPPCASAEWLEPRAEQGPESGDSRLECPLTTSCHPRPRASLLSSGEHRGDSGCFPYTHPCSEQQTHSGALKLLNPARRAGPADSLLL